MLLDNLCSKVAFDVFLNFLGCMKNSEVFSRFDYWYEACSNFAKIDIRVEHSSFIARQKIKLSSAKNKWEILGPLAHAATPFSVPSFMDFLRSAKRPFTHSKNK